MRQDDVMLSLTAARGIEALFSAESLTNGAVCLCRPPLGSDFIKDCAVSNVRGRVTKISHHSSTVCLLF